MPSRCSLREGEDPQEGLYIEVESENGSCPLTGSCRTEQELASEVQQLRQELGRLLQEGKNRLQELRHSREQGEQPRDPAQIWEIIDGLTDEQEMIEYFNSLSRELRSAVANYVLTQISAFKGMAPVFASRYNAETHYLE